MGFDHVVRNCPGTAMHKKNGLALQEFGHQLRV
jgi:hypothetical protein